MNTVSKKSMFFAVMAGLVSLTACVGGGGGGSGSTPLAPRPTITASEITGGMPQQGYLAEDYSNTGDNGGLEASLKNDGLTAQLGENGNGPTLIIKEGNSIDVFAEYGPADRRLLRAFHFADLPLYGEKYPELVIGTGEITDETANFLEEDRRGTRYDHADWGPMNEDPAKPIVYFTGTALGSTEFMALNSGPVKVNSFGQPEGLEYAAFGAWGVKSGWVGTFEWNGQSKTYTGNDPYTDITFIPVSGGNSAHNAVPAANANFTGKAIAMATQYRGSTLEKPVQYFFAGKEAGIATLTIDAGGKSGNLAMSFPNFYNIGFKFNVDNNEFRYDKNQMPTVTDNGNTYDIQFPQNITGASLSGNFYGPSGSASEASGRFEIGAKNDITGDQFMFDGSFGVKQ